MKRRRTSRCRSPLQRYCKEASAKVVLIVMIISADHIKLIGDGVLCPSPEYLQNLVMGVKGGVGDIRVVDGGTSKAEKISCNIIKSGLGIAGRHKLNPFVSSIQFKWPVGVFCEQRHAGIIGDRSSQNLRQDRRQRVASGPQRVPGEPDRHSVCYVSVNCIEGKHAVRQVGNVPSDLKRITTVRAIVLRIATELP